jgi:hypothetical protein
VKGLAGLVLAGLVVLAGCGGSSTSHPDPGAIAGNWQFTLQRTTVPHTTTLLSGFLQQTGKAVTGAVEFTPPLPIPAPPCSGAFQVTGSNDGQNVTLAVNEGGATVSLTGTSSASSMGGTYSLAASGCGKDESGTWTASLVQPLNGNFQGILHSTDTTGLPPIIKDSDFKVVGQILQSDNIGATRAMLTGTINVPNADYPCFTDATLSGSITGTVLTLDIIGTNGAVLGTIGGAGTFKQSEAVTAKPDGSGFFDFNGHGYFVSKSSGCSHGEQGSICVDIGTATSCKQPVAFSQTITAFNPILVATSSPSQTVTLTNQSSSALDLTSLSVQGANPSDFAVDTSGCPSMLAAQANCPIVVAFTPTASCPPLNPGFSEPLLCPLARTAAISLSTGPSDPDSPHMLQLTGIGMDPVIPDAPVLNFGVIPVGSISPPLTVTFTNQGPAPVTISSIETGGNDPTLGTPFSQCGTSTSSPLNVCDFVTKNQVVPANNCTPPPTLQDSCTGQAIMPGGSCKVDFVFCPLVAHLPPPPPARGGIVEDIQIVTDEHDANGVPTADSTRVPVELDGSAN